MQEVSGRPRPSTVRRVRSPRPLVRRALAVLAVGVVLLAAIGMVIAATVGQGQVRRAGLPQRERPGRPIIIRWSTESEVNTAGYNIYRATNKEGPWEKINERLIPGSPDPLRGGTYAFTDTTVIAGQTYWYELEEVELDGKTTRLERIRTTAEPLRSNPLAGLPCLGGVLLFGAVGAVAIGGRRQKVSTEGREEGRRVKGQGTGERG